MAQVVVYGPNGARTTANTVFTEADKAAGYTMSEYDRLIAGQIPGREGYVGASQTEPLTPEYPGDYGGEDASTPTNERESVVGIGNTNYDTKDYSNVGEDGEVVIKNEDGSVYSPIAKRDMPIPTGAEYWNVDGEYYIVYYIPGTNTPIYYDSSLEDLKNIFGPVEFPGIEQTIKSPTAEEWNSAIRFGDSLELADPNVYNPEVSPWSSFIDTIATESKIRPWLQDAEMIERLAEATLEGRTVTDAEWQSTNWWRTHTQAERDWLLLAQSNATDFTSVLTADAERKIQDDKAAIKNLMEQSGISNPSDELVSWVGQKLTTGLWSDSYVAEQVKVLSDPTLETNMDVELDNFITSGAIDYDTTRAGESQVKRLSKEIMGPVFGGNLAENQISKWAGMIRNDPDAEIEIRDKMMSMVKGLFGENTAEGLTYEEIAAPWRGFTSNVWGGTLDETSNLFQNVIKANDITKANQLLYTAGLQDGGSEKIKTEVKNNIVGAFGGGSVRRIV
jgi:hypothetical protein